MGKIGFIGEYMKRPLLISVLLYALGIFIAELYTWNIMIIILIVSFCFFAFLASKLKNKFIIIGYIFLVFGIINFYCHTSEEKVIEDGNTVVISGEVLKIKKSDKSKIILKTDDNYNVICYLSGSDNIGIGDRITVKGRVSNGKKQRNPGGYNEYFYFKIQNIDYKCNGYVSKIEKTSGLNFKKNLYLLRIKIEDIYDKLLPKQESGLIKAMVLGDTLYLDSNTRETYQNVGIAHIFAISGLHISIVAGFIFYILNFIKCPPRITSILIVVILGMYCIFTGNSISTRRAFIMTSVLLLGKVFYRKSDIYTTVSLAGLIILLEQPLFLFEVGFLLSFSAVIGLIIFAPVADKMFFIPIYFRKIMGASIGVTIFMVPIISYYFYKVPIYGILLNIIVVPLLMFVIGFAIIGGLIGTVSISIGQFFIGIVYYILRLYSKLGEVVLKLPCSTILLGRPNFYVIIIYYITIGCLIMLFYNNVKINMKWKRYLAGLNIVLFIMFSLISNVRTGLEIIFLDVGQGDSEIIHTKNGKNIIIDGGKRNKNVVESYLDFKGINQIDIMILTHPDEDHIGGLIELIDVIHVDNIIVSDVDFSSIELYNEFISKANDKNVKITKVATGDRICLDQVIFNILLPQREIYFDNINNNSVVLSLEYEELKMMFTGDIEQEQEKYLEDNLLKDEFQVLKVAHHGSSTSTTGRFLDTITPSIGVISCGANNIYGHPNKQVLNGLKDRNVEVFVTADDGAIIITINKKVLKLKSMLGTFKK